MKHSYRETHKELLKFIFKIRGSIIDVGHFFISYKGAMVTIDEAIMLEKTDRLLKHSKNLRDRILNEKLVDSNL